jgi:hypothetical protein
MGEISLIIFSTFYFSSNFLKKANLVHQAHQAKHTFRFLIIRIMAIIMNMLIHPKRVDTRARNMTVDRMRTTTMIGIMTAAIKDISEAIDMENVLDF